MHPKLITPALTLTLLLSLSACGQMQQREVADDTAEKIAILGTAEALRATQTAFGSGDRIGVYALAPGGSDITGSYANLPYTSDASGLFSADGTAVTGQRGSMDLAAYYPYDAAVTGTTLSFDLSDQSDPAAKDLLWGKVTADKVTGARVPMTFRHLLGLVEIAFVQKDAAHPLPSTIPVTVKGLLTDGTADLVTGTLAKGTVRKEVTLTPDAAGKVSLLMIPGETLSALSFTFDGKAAAYTLPEPITAKGGAKASLTLRPYKSGSVITVAPYAEIPVSVTERPGTRLAMHFAPDSYFAGGSTPGGSRRNYSILFDEESRQPLWVAYPMYDDCMGSADRTNAWDWDPDLPKSIQPVLEGSYQPQSMGFNRGHMVSSASRTASRELNKTTFYYTNMIPQNSYQNSGIWNQLENKEQSWAKSDFDTLFIVCGPIFTEAAPRYVQDDNGNEVRVPDQVFKAILTRTASGQWRSMAVRMPNVTPPKGDSWKNHMVTVRSLEEELGFTFFTHLPADVADEVKSQNNPGQWN